MRMSGVYDRVRCTHANTFTIETTSCTNPEGDPRVRPTLTAPLFVINLIFAFLPFLPLFLPCHSFLATAIQTRFIQKNHARRFLEKKKKRRKIPLGNLRRDYWAIRITRYLIVDIGSRSGNGKWQWSGDGVRLAISSLFPSRETVTIGSSFTLVKTLPA